MIIVEGPDGAGKSTLVEKLSEELNLTIGERATTDRNKLYEVTRQDTYTALGEAVTAHTRPKIWDRLFFSEMVYAPVVGRECEFSHEEQTFVRRVLTAMGTPIVVCLPPWSVVQGNVEGSEQMPGVEENLKQIYSHYGSVTKGMPFVLFYDYTGEQSEANYRTYSQLKAACEHYFTHREQRSWR